MSLSIGVSFKSIKPQFEILDDLIIILLKALKISPNIILKLLSDRNEMGFFARGTSFYKSSELQFQTLLRDK